MATMHRFQTGLPHDLYQFLARTAERDGVSVAEVIRRLVAREAAEALPASAVDYVLGMVGKAFPPDGREAPVADPR